MPRTTPFTVALAIVLVAVTGCDREVDEEDGNSEGRSSVEGDGDGEGEGEGEGEGDDGAGGDGGSGDGGEGGDDAGNEVCDPESPAPLECCPGERRSCFTNEEDLEAFGDMQQNCVEGGWQEGGCDTPLVLSFDAREPLLEPSTDRGTMLFDLAGEGQGVVTDWPKPETPWLVLDRDGDGRIGDGRELFGSGTVLASGARAKHGFEALSELDADGNGVLDAGDPGFANLALWSDHDGDRQSESGELSSISAGDRRLVAIDLGYRVEARCDARGNCGIERATFRWEDVRGIHDGEIVDVHLRRR